MERSHRSFGIILIVALSSLALIACGGGGGPTAVPTATQPPPSPAVPTATQPPPSPTVPPTPSASDHIEQGKTYFDDGEMAKAVAEFEAAAELEPDNAQAYANLGAAYAEQDQFDVAMTVLEKALQLDHDLAKAHTNLCFVYSSLDRFEEALAECNAALELRTDDADTFNNLGVIYLKQDKLDQAIVELQRAIRIDPDHDWAHNNLGRLYSNQGKFEQAIAELNEAVRVDPEHEMAHYNLGVTYARMEAYDQAVPEYEVALEIAPELTSIHKDLGVVYGAMGKTEDAIAHFEAFLEFEPNDPARAAIEAEIAKLKESLISIELVPFTSAELGISGVAPAGWTQEGPGVYVSPDGQVIGQTVAPGKTMDQIAELLLIDFGIAALPESTGTAQPSDLEWYLYMIEEAVVFDRLGSVALAIAEDDAGAYAIALFAQPEEIEELIETVGSPALVAFVYQPQETNGGMALVPFSDDEMDISGVVPADWERVNPGVYVGPEGQVILQLAVPGVDAEIAVSQFLASLEVDELPESGGSHTSDTLTWNLYTLDGVEMSGQVISVALALAGDSQGAYLIALFAKPDELGTLVENVGYPALDAFTFTGE